ncbi:hypothetical protein HF086_014738 [Spodoptera exigua]|uniref:Uncharacterized protein n=1 Tax=Spodoptera exigua TaxID=7107 RepID=A0A922M7B7_SPOEX|nr:hypothetical protein HF086_014738 [Spodoptera exigua]
MAKIKEDEQEHETETLQKTRKIETFLKVKTAASIYVLHKRTRGLVVIWNINMNKGKSEKPAHPTDSDIQKPSTSGTNIKSDSEEMAAVATLVEIESTIKLNKDPAFWGINDLTRDIIARNAF